jgi:DNA-binding XRE family transcriptional regulator
MKPRMKADHCAFTRWQEYPKRKL